MAKRDGLIHPLLRVDEEYWKYPYKFGYHRYTRIFEDCIDNRGVHLEMQTIVCTVPYRKLINLFLAFLDQLNSEALQMIGVPESPFLKSDRNYRITRLPVKEVIGILNEYSQLFDLDSELRLVCHFETVPVLLSLDMHGAVCLGYRQDWVTNEVRKWMSGLWNRYELYKLDKVSYPEQYDHSHVAREGALEVKKKFAYALGNAGADFEIVNE